MVGHSSNALSEWWINWQNECVTLKTINVILSEFLKTAWSRTNDEQW